MKQAYDIVGSFNQQRYLEMDAERTINMFEYIDPNDKGNRTLINTSGLTKQNLYFSGETGGSRASYVFKDIVYQVFGGSLFRMEGGSGGFTVSKLGTLNTDSGYAKFTANETQLLLVDGQDGWIFDTISESLVRITDPNFPTNPIDATVLDNFFIVISGGTNSFQLSYLNNGLVWGPIPTNSYTIDTTSNYLILSTIDNSYCQTGTPVFVTTSGGGSLPPELALDTIYYCIKDETNNSRIRLATTSENAYNNNYITYSGAGSPTQSLVGVGEAQVGQITSHPGNIVACATLHRRLFLFSAFYTEVWENAGIGTNLPFRRNNSLLMEVGSAAIGSVVVGFDRLFFLSQNRDGMGSVMMVKGTEASPISTKAIDYHISQFATNSTSLNNFVADARAVVLQESGVIFYRLNFTDANTTYVFNLSMSSDQNLIWHEESLLNGDRHPGQTNVFYQGNNYLADYRFAKFYLLNNKDYTNDGEAIKRVRIGKPVVPSTYNRVRVDRFQIDFVQGIQEQGILELQTIEAESGFTLLTESGDELLTENQILSYTEEPVVFLSYSKDGGTTYGNLIKSSMGKIGERSFRTLWRKLGVIPRGQAFVPKIEFYNNAPFVIMGAMWAFEVLPE